MRQYNTEELCSLICGNADTLKIEISQEGISTIANVSRGTPRLANNFLEWIRDYKIAKEIGCMRGKEVLEALEMQGIDKEGLTPIDRNYLNYMEKLPNEHPVGVNTLCSALNIDRQTIEQKIEPWLIQKGLVLKTAKGRVLVRN